MNLNRKNKKYIFLTITVISLIGLFISIYNIVNYIIDEKNIKNQLNIIEENIGIEEISQIDKVEIVNQEEILDTNPYWDYIKMNLIDIDFKDLKKINNNVKGWIQINGTNINYPFVQGKDNDYYLNHSFDKTNNAAGWVFLDYRNDISNFEDKNTIIYAHGRKDKTMFGTLKNTLSSDWLENSNNYVVKLSTEYENTLWQVFSIYHMKTTSDYLQINFRNEDEFSLFTKMLIDRSDYDFNTAVSGSDRIITLSTCYNKSQKFVLHAKLIKRMKK